jgi:hypothetical protein
MFGALEAALPSGFIIGFRACTGLAIVRVIRTCRWQGHDAAHPVVHVGVAARKRTTAPKIVRQSVTAGRASNIIVARGARDEISLSLAISYLLFWNLRRLGIIALLCRRRRLARH